MAIRDDEDKAAGIGVVTPIYKGLAFMASAVLVGIAGAVYGYYISFLSVSTMFDVVLSMQLVLAALLGGRGTGSGGPFWAPSSWCRWRSSPTRPSAEPVRAPSG